MPKHNTRQSLAYAIILVFASLASVGVLIKNPMLGDSQLIWGAVIFLVLMALAFWDISIVVLGTVMLLPALAGLESYRVDVTPVIQFIGIDKNYQVDAFFLARIFILFLTGVEFLRRGTKVMKTPLFFILFFSMALNAVTFFLSAYKIQGIAFYWFHLVAAFGAYFLGYFLFGTVKGYLKLIGMILFSTIIPMLVSLKQILARDFFYENDSTLPRLQATFWHPNKLGSYLFVILTVYLISYLAVEIKERGRRASLPIYPAAVWGLMFALTFSRTSWIALALAVILVAVVKKSVRLPAAYLGAGLLFLALLVGRVRDRILGIFSRQVNDSVTGRVEIWDMAIYEFKQQPVTGFGPGSFSEIIKLVRGSEQGNLSPHSDVIRFLVEGGILGVLAYAFYMVGVLYYAGISYLTCPQTHKEISLWRRRLVVDVKLLGLIPLLLFALMIPVSLMETPTLDFVYQAFAWILLGSWLKISNFKFKIAK